MHDTNGNRMFPILPPSTARCPEIRAYVPWGKVAPHEKQALSNHGQTLQGLASRGGLSMCELAAVLEDRKWRAMDKNDAKRTVERLIGEPITV